MYSYEQNMNVTWLVTMVFIHATYMTQDMEMNLKLCYPRQNSTVKTPLCSGRLIVRTLHLKEALLIYSEPVLENKCSSEALLIFP
jgi:hypothetical protein